VSSTRGVVGECCIRGNARAVVDRRDRDPEDVGRRPFAPIDWPCARYVAAVSVHIRARLKLSYSCCHFAESNQTQPRLDVHNLSAKMLTGEQPCRTPGCDRVHVVGVSQIGKGCSVAEMQPPVPAPALDWAFHK